MLLIDPLNNSLEKYKKESHLTDAQNQGEEVRILGKLETCKKILHIARSFLPYINTNTLVFVINHHFKALEYLSTFIYYFQFYGNSKLFIQIQFSPENIAANYPYGESKHAETLFFATKNQESIQPILEIANACAYAGDYYSAINFLLSLKEIKSKDDTIQIVIYYYLALYYQIIEDTIDAEFYYRQCLSFEKDSIYKAKVYFGLSMLYTKYHSKLYLDSNKSIDYIQKSFVVLLAKEKSDTNEVYKVFNRNGLALILFQKGKLQEAQQLVEQGIKKLNVIHTQRSHFTKLVLCHNLCQIFYIKKQYDKAESMLKSLINQDSSFFYYYELLAELYLNIQKNTDALATLEQGIAIDPNNFKFYFLLGKMYYQQKNYAMAIVYFEKAYTINLYDLSSICYLSSLYNYQKEFNKTINLTKNFHIKFYNHFIGALIFYNQCIALINTNTKLNFIKSIVKEALTISPTTPLLQNLAYQLTLL